MFWKKKNFSRFLVSRIHVFLQIDFPPTTKTSPKIPPISRPNLDTNLWQVVWICHLCRHKETEVVIVRPQVVDQGTGGLFHMEPGNACERKRKKHLQTNHQFLGFFNVFQGWKHWLLELTWTNLELMTIFKGPSCKYSHSIVGFTLDDAY